MFYHLPPVGNSVCLRVDASRQPDPAITALLSSNQFRYYASGTAALAAALVAALKLKNIESAEVILPAYGCPDLVSAVEFAGAKPVLVDFEAGLPWLDLQQLAAAITDRTVAIVAVNLFGISERWRQLRELADKNSVVLIEDSAQYFPGGEEKQDWQGDIVVFSFGRGKPVSLLGGGAVLVNKTSLLDLLPQVKQSTAKYRHRLAYYLKGKLYNAMILPCLYWLPQSLPFLHLGETRYHPLPEIEAMNQEYRDLLLENVFCYQSDGEAVARCRKTSSMLDSLANLQGRLINLPRVCEAKENRRLLRFPLLLEPELRDYVYLQLKQAGLGVSIMYPVSLMQMADMGHLLGDRESYPNAENFASRILTLPLHAGVRETDIDKMKAILSSLD